MQENDKPILIYATAPGLAVAETIAATLVERRLAACVNILPGMVAIYEWQGTRHRDAEVVMIAKTRGSLAAEAMAAIRAGHPYENPAIVVIAIVDGAAPFLAWIAAQTESAP